MNADAKPLTGLQAFGSYFATIVQIFFGVGSWELLQGKAPDGARV